MAKKFQPGNTVQLKSGGPEMTVKKYETHLGLDGTVIESETNVVCEWFAGNDLRSATFSQDSLDIVDEE